MLIRKVAFEVLELWSEAEGLIEGGPRRGGAIFHK